MNRRTVDLLEFDKIRRLLASETSFGPGHDAALALEPSTDPDEVSRRQAETTEARRLLDRAEGVPMGGLRDIRPFLEAAMSGDVLEPAQLLDVAQTCRSAERLRKFLVARQEKCPTLSGLAGGIGDFSELVADIERCVTDRAEIADTASRKLASVRSAARTTQARTKEKLESLIRSPQARNVLQEPIITLRDDRYVVPVRAEHAGSLPGGGDAVR